MSRIFLLGNDREPSFFLEDVLRVLVEELANIRFTVPDKAAKLDPARSAPFASPSAKSRHSAFERCGGFALG